MRIVRNRSISGETVPHTAIGADGLDDAVAADDQRVRLMQERLCRIDEEGVVG